MNDVVFAEAAIHRHTGGLESQQINTQRQNRIHRHTGGLETISSCIVNILLKFILVKKLKYFAFSACCLIIIRL